VEIISREITVRLNISFIKTYRFERGCSGSYDMLARSGVLLHPFVSGRVLITPVFDSYPTEAPGGESGEVLAFVANLLNQVFLRTQLTKCCLRWLSPTR
jgi:hypothetical protein